MLCRATSLAQCLQQWSSGGSALSSSSLLRSAIIIIISSSSVAIIVVLVLLVVTIIIGVLYQVGLVLYMRDSLVLMAVTFVVRSEKVRKSSP